MSRCLVVGFRGWFFLGLGFLSEERERSLVGFSSSFDFYSVEWAVGGLVLVVVSLFEIGATTGFFIGGG